MSGVDERIKGDWFEVREALGSVSEVRVKIGVPEPQIAEDIHGLQQSPGGLPGYKKTRLRHAFETLEDAKYRTLESDELRSLHERFLGVALVCAVQHMIVDGTIPLPRRDVAQEVPNLEIKEVIAEVQQRSVKEEGFRARPAIKNILMLISRYQREMESIKKLSVGKSKEQAAMYLRNAQNTFAEIFAGIKRNYATVIEEDMAADASVGLHPLAVVDLSRLAKPTYSQLQEVMRMAGTIGFARQEGYGVRELIVGLAAEREGWEKLVAREMALYDTVSAGTNLSPDGVNQHFVSEIVRVLERFVTKAAM